MNCKQPLSEKHQAPPYPSAPTPNLLASVLAPSRLVAAATAPPIGPRRTLRMYRDGITSRHMTITSMDKSHPLYRMDHNSAGVFSSKPHITISQPAQWPNMPATTVGTATFHQWSSTIDLEFHGHPVSFDSEEIFTGMSTRTRWRTYIWCMRSYAYQSPVFGERLRWECRGNQGADLVLLDERRGWLASINSFLFSVRKGGTIAVVSESITGAALDEILVSGCAMVLQEKKRRKREARAQALSRMPMYGAER